jgi:hypothetical protein
MKRIEIGIPYKIVLDSGRKYNGPKVGKSLAASFSATKPGNDVPTVSTTNSVN